MVGHQLFYQDYPLAWQHSTTHVVEDPILELELLQPPQIAALPPLSLPATTLPTFTLPATTVAITLTFPASMHPANTHPTTLPPLDPSILYVQDMTASMANMKS